MKDPNITPERQKRLDEMRAAMHNILSINERAKKGEATESELAELQALKDDIAKTPDGILEGG